MIRFIGFAVLALLTAWAGGAGAYSSSPNARVISIALDSGKSQFTPGEKIPVKYMISGNAGYPWAVLVPNSVPHGDSNQAREKSLSTKYLGSTGTGTVHFRAPSQAGSYEIRLFSGDYPSVELSSLFVGVVDAPPAQSIAPSNPPSSNLPGRLSVEMRKSWMNPNESMKVNYTLPGTEAVGAWMGLFDQGADNGKYLSRWGLYRVGTGNLTLRAPMKPGQYEIRLFDSPEGSPLATFSFRVMK